MAERKVNLRQMAELAGVDRDWLRAMSNRGMVPRLPDPLDEYFFDPDHAWPAIRALIRDAMPDRDELVTSKQAARRFYVRQRTIMDLKDAGLLDGEFADNAWRFRVADVADALRVVAGSTGPAMRPDKSIELVGLREMASILGTDQASLRGLVIGDAISHFTYAGKVLFNPEVVAVQVASLGSEMASIRKLSGPKKRAIAFGERRG